MAQPMSAPSLATARRIGRMPGALPADRFAGRWPATDQLVAEIASPRPTAQTTVVAPVGIERQQQAERIEFIDHDPVREVQPQDEIALHTGAAAEAQVDGRLELAAGPQPVFLERMEAITEQFSNPSTGETSVDRPLATVDEHEADYEYEAAPSQRQTIPGPRL